ncbi:MAG: hypothetical protein R3242_10465, partial [Akkermansiaceae bacterium]|nr:hypothetical protein [Akkermansiaceae bacterium]
MKRRVVSCGLHGLWVLCLTLAPAIGQPDEETPTDPPVARPVLPQDRALEEDDGPIEPVIEDRVVISSSKQFRISGGNALGRGLCAILAENAKEELLMLLERPDDWKIAVSVRLHGEPGDEPPSHSILTRLQVVEGVYTLHLDLHLAKGLPVDRFKQAILEMLVYERALRDLPLLEEGMALSVPPWLGVGLREACAWRMQEADRRLYAAMFKQGGAYKVNDLLALTRNEYAQLDEASEVAFRVSAGALV